MRAYRLAFQEHIQDLTGTGARLYGGRWNPKGVGCLYGSAHISLALLEKFVHAQGREMMAGLMLLQIEIPDDNLIYHVDVSQMADDWPVNFDYSQWLGGQILADANIVAFSVPSAIVHSERNIIINPQAEYFDSIKFSKPTIFNIDQRLLVRV